jgi:cell division protein FtsQ
MAKAVTKRRKKTYTRPGPRQRLLNGVRSGKLLALAVLLVAGGLLVGALLSRQYVIRHVEVVGGEALTEAHVETLAGVTGRTIWFVQPNEVEARVRQSPYVEQVWAQMRLPDTLVVRVTERRPEVQWIHAGTAYAVSQDGLILSAAPITEVMTDTVVITDTATVTDTAVITDTQPLTETDVASDPTSTLAPSDVPASVDRIMIIDRSDNSALKPGDRVNPDAIEVARRVMLRSSELPVPLQRIEWTETDGVSLFLSGRQAVIGTSERLDEKLAIMTTLLHDRTEFSYIDLRPSAPYYR